MTYIQELYPIPPEVEKLSVFIGDWNVTGTLKIGNDKMNVNGKWFFNKAAGGWGLRSANKLEIDGMGSYELDNLFGFDKEEGRLHIYSLTNMAETHDHRASWTDGSTLKGEYDGLKDGKKFREDFVIRILDPARITINYIEKVDDKIDSTMSLILQK